MKGYKNNPEANKEVFIGDWLRTGDLGSIDEDGAVFIHDRLKELIKVTILFFVYRVLDDFCSAGDQEVVGSNPAARLIFKFVLCLDIYK